MSPRQDVTFAARLLRRNPVFTATAVLSLAIGIAANAAIFSLADALLLRARPGIAGPDGLVDVGRTQDGQGFDNLSYPNYVDFRDRNTVFTGLLREDGWTLIRQRGSHRQFAHPVKPGLVTVSGSANDDIHPGTLNNIRTQAGLK
jgi:predicted RNA binding protein YcfA (HicA-like mRNA interferase family)